ncbi:serine hydrolase domain-containing protein [Paremcibacter congregatus]|nr:serine hydrolase domain-containing protein [Paremcibacter congregatus]
MARFDTCEERLQAVLELHYQQSHMIYTFQIHVEAPDSGIFWQGAVGHVDRNTTSDVVTVHHPLRIASNTKTFVATAILRLWEEGHLDLDISVEPYLSAQHCDMLRAGGYELDQITTRQLLAHTSSLFDYADSPDFAEAIAANSQKHWTRTEQIQIAMTAGASYGAPGEVFRYSDTGYILLGEMIERIYGKSLGVALRQLLKYDELNLKATFLEILEPEPSDVLDRIHQYEGEVDVYDWHGSFDIYGGGGLISTVGDMARFMRGLFEGRVFNYANTLTEMLTPVPAKRGGPNYGIWQQVPGTYCLGIDGGGQGEVYSHHGHFGTSMAYVPVLEMAVALSIGGSRTGDVDLREVILADILTLF